MGQPMPVIARWLGDADEFDDLLHADAVVHAPRVLSTHDREAEKAVWLAAVAATPDLRHEVQDDVAETDIEMARVVVTGTLLSTGTPTARGRVCSADLLGERIDVRDLPRLGDLSGDQVTDYGLVHSKPLAGAGDAREVLDEAIAPPRFRTDEPAGHCPLPQVS